MRMIRSPCWVLQGSTQHRLVHHVDLELQPAQSKVAAHERLHLLAVGKQLLERRMFTTRVPGAFRVSRAAADCSAAVGHAGRALHGAGGIGNRFAGAAAVGGGATRSPSQA